MNYKQCKNCNTINALRGNMYCSECKVLVQKRQISQWYKNNPEKIREYDRKRGERRKERRKNDPEYAAKQRAKDAIKYERIHGPKIPKRKEDGLLLECMTCGKMLPRGRFERQGKNKNGHWKRRGECRTCARPAQRARQHARNGAPGKFTAADIRALEKKQAMMCACGCGKSLHAGYHIDHIVPLARGGSNWPANLQLLTPLCNLRKCAKPIPAGTPIPPGSSSASSRRTRIRENRAAWLRAQLARVGMAI